MKRVALHLSEATEIVIHVGAKEMIHREEDTPLPPRPLTIPQKEPRFTACMKAVYVTVCKAPSRLTKSQIAVAMEAAGLRYSDSAIEHALADLVRGKLLSNDPKANPPGYAPLMTDG